MPGADSSDRAWQVINEKRRTISQLPDWRWSEARFCNPGDPQAARTFTMAAGVLDDPFAFDANYFRISRREAEQMDPQQRLLLETVARAFDHSGLAPQELDRKRTGVYVGASAADHSATMTESPEQIGPHFMMGNTLSILANRISYAWDFQGPSLTVDTACSSSLFALDLARGALERGEIDTAVVAGVNLLLSPLPFIGFSQATMLSKRGYCAPFQAGADGYVRSEGAVAFVLQRRSLAELAKLNVRSTLVATAVNTDGATNGLPLPSSSRQAELIESVVDDLGVDPQALAFIEAHGTGTPVGDPCEAAAIGRGYGSRRTAPLPITSAKANFGHLEPAAGLVGLLKAQLCLEQGILPAGIHDGDLNPDIDFQALNIAVPGDDLRLGEREGGWLAAINSFGFGGANAHAVLRQADRSTVITNNRGLPPSLLISAADKDALRDLAQSWQQLAEQDSPDLADSIATANRRLARHPFRICLEAGSSKQLERNIADWLNGENSAERVSGADLPVGFVFSGNGTAWAGMAREVFAANKVFSGKFKAAAAAFVDLGLEDIESLLFDPALAEKLDRAEIVQPLIFAIQLAIAEALSALGIKPAATLGHSVGECAAAVVAERLDLEEAARIIVSRSLAFEPLRGTGCMAALSCAESQARTLIDELGLPLDISADNAPKNVTVSGSAEDISTLLKAARKRRLSGLRLEIAYPFHSRAVDGIDDKLANELGAVEQRFSGTAFYSGWMGARADDVALDASYWRKNAREKVAFREAVSTMAADGIGVMVEIGPRSALLGNLRDICTSSGSQTAILPSLEKGKRHGASIGSVARRIAMAGGALDELPLLGPRRKHLATTPDYPFRKDVLRIEPTRGFAARIGEGKDHPLLGRRVSRDDFAWLGGLSTARLPWLADHKVKGKVLLPAMAMLEIFRASSVEIAEGRDFALHDIEFLKPVTLQEEALDSRVDYDQENRTLRLSVRIDGFWSPVARASLRLGAPPLGGIVDSAKTTAPDGLYEALRQAGLEYGVAFARISGVATSDTSATLTVRDRAESSDCESRVCRSDALLHGMAMLTAETGARVPYRIARARFAEGGVIERGRLAVLAEATTPAVDVEAADETGRVVIGLEGVLLARLPDATKAFDPFFAETIIPVTTSKTPTPRPGFRPADPEGEAEPTDLDISRSALAGRLAWDLAFGQNMQGDERRVGFARDWLVQRGLARRTETGLFAETDCPWPELDELLLLLAEGLGHGSDELAACLAAVSGHGQKQPPPLARARQQATRLIASLTSTPNHIVLAGDIDDSILEAASGKAGRVSVAGRDPAALDLTVARLNPGASFAASTYEELARSDPFDLLLCVSTLCTENDGAKNLAALTHKASAAILIDEAPDAFALLTRRYSSQASFASALRAFGVADTIPVDGDQALIMHYVEGQVAAADDGAWAARVQGDSRLAETLRSRLPISATGVLVHVLSEGATTADRVRAMQDCAGSTQSGETVWVVDQTTAAFGELTALRRVAVNETRRDIRTLNADRDVSAEALLALLRNSEEQEVIMTANGAHAPRFGPAQPTTPPDPALRQVLTAPEKGLKRVPEWRSRPRQKPGDGEVEIEVQATGVNFRDVMLAEGSLPDDAFLGGYAGRNLGIECAGRVLRAGPGTGLAKGDAVVAFAAGAFASHITVPQNVTMPLPEDISPTAGATLPVAFLTADYALRECARLEAGESVLIHGGAGGVGIAAIQIARLIGATVYATAGTPGKRRLLTAMGVEQVFDSRSLGFADELHAATGGKGVDAVINSLAGPFIESSLDCLAPFGRFVELGKRDIFQNARLGMRVLRNNISFFAVDADQLLRERPAKAERVMERLGDAFRSGQLTALPRMTFAAENASLAFETMRRAEHIGKIVVTAPTTPAAGLGEAPGFRGTWLVTGGTRGFGLATAQWLAAKGVKTLWLASRSGRLAPSERARIEQNGVAVRTRALDVADKAALQALLHEIETKSGPLHGVVHAAMVLDDVPLGEMSPARLNAVLSPKLGGAKHLADLTRDMALEHFWLYSSAATRFGNPGQSAYAAANGALEDIARQLKGEGRAALAVAWPAIRDAGYLVGEDDLRDRIEAHGMASLGAFESLDLLETAIRMAPDRATVTIAPADWQRLSADLPVFKGPLFEKLRLRPGDSATNRLDLGGLIAELGPTKAQEVVAATLGREIALLLRLPEDTVDASVSLGDLGFDSLMGMQLQVTVEERLGTGLPANILNDRMTLARLAGLIVEAKTTASSTADLAAQAMAERHLVETDLSEEAHDRIIKGAS